MKLLPYQKEDAKKACTVWKNRPVYFGHDMGLGKTAITITCWRWLKAHNILVVCPASVRPVWRDEVEKWFRLPAHVQTVTEGNTRLVFKKQKANVVIISYDLAVTPDMAKQLLAKQWDVLTFDEAHSLGNPSSKRTKLCMGSLFRRAKKCFALSGSIQRDKVNNVWPVFRTFCPEHIPTYSAFIDRYVYTKRRRYGLQFLGGKNLDELGQIARKHFLIRRTKEEVLKDLPEKMEQKLLVELPRITQQKLEAACKEFAPEFEAAIEAGSIIADDPAMSTLRRELGEEKVPYAIETILELTGNGSSPESCGKLVVACYHHSVLDALQKAANKRKLSYTGISGKSSPKARDEAIRKFQKDPKCQLFLCTYAAAEGITLTAASTILVVEMSWQLSQNEQIQDRLHRIGQKDTVYVKFLLLENTLDMIVYNVYKRKSRDKHKAFGNEQTNKRKTRTNGSEFKTATTTSKRNSDRPATKAVRRTR